MKNIHKVALVATFASFSIFGMGCPTATDCVTSADCGDVENPICQNGTCAKTCDATVETSPFVCADDQVCNVGTGICEGGGDDVNACDGTVDDDVCTAKNTLCDANTKTCEDADTVVGECGAADKFASNRNDGAPLIFDAVAERDASSDTACEGAVAGTQAFVFSFTYIKGDAEVGTVNGDTIDIDADAFQAARADLDAPFGPTQFPAMAVEADGVFVGTFMVCFANAPDQIAIQIKDNADKLSNAACGDVK